MKFPAFILPILFFAQSLYGQHVAQSLIYRPGVTVPFQGVKLANNNSGEVLAIMQGTNEETFLLLIDANGKGKWSLKINNLTSRMKGISIGYDNSWLLYGTIRSITNELRHNDYELIKISAQGDLVWRTQFGTKFEENPIGAFELPNQRALIAGTSIGQPESSMEAIIISLGDGKPIKNKTFRSSPNLYANSAALVNDKLYFWGSNVDPTPMVYPIVSAIDTSLEKLSAYSFSDMTGMIGVALTDSKKGIPTLCMTGRLSMAGSFLFEFNPVKESGKISARRLIDPLSVHTVSKLIKTPSGYILAGQRTSQIPTGPPIVAALDNSFNTTNGYVDTSYAGHALDDICVFGNNGGLVYSRNITFHKKRSGKSFRTGASLRLAGIDATPSCPQRRFTFQHVDTSVSYSSIPAAFANIGSYTVRTPITATDMALFAVEPSCQPLDVDASFDLSDSIICQGDSISITNNAVGAAQFSWYFNGASIDSFNGFSPPMLTFKQYGQFSITQIAQGLNESDTLVRRIRVIRTPDLRLPNDSSICTGDTIKLEAKGFIEDQYTWSPSEAVSPANERLTFFHPKRRTTIKATVSNAGKCMVADSFVLDVIQDFELSLSQSTDSLCPGDKAELKVASGDFSIKWSTGDTSQTIEVDNEGLYEVTLGNRCFEKNKSAEIFNKEICATQVLLPNAFSPNNDGHNDIWKPVLQFVRSAELKIYGRWGQIVYYEHSASPSWDGKLREGEVMPGIYLYELKLMRLNGQEDKTMGRITVLR